MKEGKWIALLLLVFLVKPAAAQDLNSDLARIMHATDSARSIHITAAVDVYSKKGGTKVFTANASVKRSGSTVSTVLDEQEYFSNQQYYVTVDHDEKRVAVVRNDERKNQNKLDGLGLDIRELKKFLRDDEVEDHKVVKLISSADGIHVYSLTNMPALEEIKITLDMNKNTIAGVAYHYADNSEYKGQYIVVSYTKFNRNAEVSGNLLQSNFFTLSNGKVVLNQRLKDYALYTEL